VEERDIREVLAQELASAAASRREDSRQRPDRGHRQSASAVEQLIAYIRELPADDARLHSIAALNRDPDFFLLGGEETRTLIDQYGYEAENDQTGRQAGERFLDRLVAAARADDADAQHGTGLQG
jgi:hypothetical protein